MKLGLVLCLLLGVSLAREEDKDLDTSKEGTSNVKRDAPVVSSNYGPPEKEPAPVYGPPQSSGYKSYASPQSYSKSIPAAAIRNVETVAVTKTITPVVTKTTTYHTHAEPALSIGHVQGYSQSAAGQPKIAPVQFQTQYTQHLNPTVGVNGPVTYTGPAVVLGGGYAIPISLSSIGGNSLGLGSAVYGAPALSAVSSGYGAPAHSAPSSGYGAHTAALSSNYGPPPQSSAPASGYGPPGHSEGGPLGSYSMRIPQVAMRPPAQHGQQLSLLQQLRNQLAMASSLSPISIRAAPSSPYAIYRQPSPAPSRPLYQQFRPQQQQQSQQQPAAQPSVFVQTYTAPSISFTRLQPLHTLQRPQQSLPFHQQLTKANQ